MKVFLLILMLTLPSACLAGDPDPWTTQDTILQGTTTTLLLIDMAQSIQISHHPEKYVERNVLLGPHPSEGEVVPYFISMIVGHAIVSYMLPKNYRPFWQGLFIGIEATSVQHNYSIGLKTAF